MSKPAKEGAKPPEGRKRAVNLLTLCWGTRSTVKDNCHKDGREELEETVGGWHHPWLQLACATGVAVLPEGGLHRSNKRILDSEAKVEHTDFQRSSISVYFKPLQASCHPGSLLISAYDICLTRQGPFSNTQRSTIQKRYPDVFSKS